MKRGSLQKHILQQHNTKEEKYLYKEVGTAGDFCESIQKEVNNRCPIPGCTGGSMDKFRMYTHFCLRYSEAKLIIEEEGEVERCNLCRMFTENMNRHQKTKPVVLVEKGEN